MHTLQLPCEALDAHFLIVISLSKVSVHFVLHNRQVPGPRFKAQLTLFLIYVVIVEATLQPWWAHHFLINS